jgi:hypothetical protein
VLEEFNEMNQGVPYLSLGAYKNIKHLDKQNNIKFKKMLGDCRQIKIHGKSIVYDPKDPIFNL